MKDPFRARGSVLSLILQGQTLMPDVAIFETKKITYFAIACVLLQEKTRPLKKGSPPTHNPPFHCVVPHFSWDPTFVGVRPRVPHFLLEPRLFVQHIALLNITYHTIQRACMRIFITRDFIPVT